MLNKSMALFLLSFRCLHCPIGQKNLGNGFQIWILLYTWELVLAERWLFHHLIFVCFLGYFCNFLAQISFFFFTDISGSWRHLSVVNAHVFSRLQIPLWLCFWVFVHSGPFILWLFLLDLFLLKIYGSQLLLYVLEYRSLLVFSWEISMSSMTMSHFPLSGVHLYQLAHLYQLKACWASCISQS